jgi:hypothetical protein
VGELHAEPCGTTSHQGSTGAQHKNDEHRTYLHCFGAPQDRC